MNASGLLSRLCRHGYTEIAKSRYREHQEASINQRLREVETLIEAAYPLMIISR